MFVSGEILIVPTARKLTEPALPPLPFPAPRYKSPAIVVQLLFPVPLAIFSTPAPKFILIAPPPVFILTAPPAQDMLILPTPTFNARTPAPALIVTPPTIADILIKSAGATTFSPLKNRDVFAVIN